MAEFTLEELRKAITEKTSAADKWTDALKGLGETAGATLFVIGELAKTFSKTAEIITKGSDANVQFSDSENSIISAGGIVLNTVTNIQKTMSDYSAVASIGAASSKQFAANLKDVTDNIGNVFEKIGLGKAKDFLELVRKGTEQVNNLNASEEGLLNKLTKSGGVQTFTGFKGTEVDARKDFITNIDANLRNVQTTFANISTSSNIARKQVEDFGNKLMDIPGALNATAPAVSGSTDKISLLEKMLRTTRGTTGNTEDAFKAIKHEFENFGTTSEKSSSYLSAFNFAANKLGMDTEKLSNQVYELNKKFAFSGDAALSITNVYGGLTEALKQVGLGYETASKLATGYIENINGMSIAQQSFLSQQSGGSGGMLGWLEMEDLKSKEGGMEEIFKKTQDILKKQFGGRIVTKEDAVSSHSQQDANTVAREVEMLKKGPLGQFAKTDQEALKLLDAMQKGINPTDFIKGHEKQAEETEKAAKERFYDVANATVNSMIVEAATVSIQGASKERKELLEGNKLGTTQTQIEQYAKANEIKKINQADINNGSAVGKGLNETIGYMHTSANLIGNTIERIAKDLGYKAKEDTESRKKNLHHDVASGAKQSSNLNNVTKEQMAQGQTSTPEVKLNINITNKSTNENKIVNAVTGVNEQVSVDIGN